MDGHWSQAHWSSHFLTSLNHFGDPRLLDCVFWDFKLAFLLVSTLLFIYPTATIQHLRDIEVVEHIAAKSHGVVSQLSLKPLCLIYRYQTHSFEAGYRFNLHTFSFLRGNISPVLFGNRFINDDSSLPSLFQYLPDPDEEVAEMTKKKQRDCEVCLALTLQQPQMFRACFLFPVHLSI